MNHFHKSGHQRNSCEDINTSWCSRCQTEHHFTSTDRRKSAGVNRIRALNWAPIMARGLPSAKGCTKKSAVKNLFNKEKVG
jgi:hypothetical protein